MLQGENLGLTEDQVNLVALRLSTDGRVQCRYVITTSQQWTAMWCPECRCLL